MFKEFINDSQRMNIVKHIFEILEKANSDLSFVMSNDVTNRSMISISCYF